MKEEETKYTISIEELYNRWIEYLKINNLKIPCPPWLKDEKKEAKLLKQKLL